MDLAVAIRGTGPGAVKTALDEALAAARELDSKIELPDEAKEGLPLLGADTFSVEWVLVSANLKDDDVALAVCGDNDLPAYIDKWRKFAKDNNEEFDGTEFECEGEKAWYAQERRTSNGRPAPCFASLDGKLMIVAGSPASLARQIRLYRKGEGEDAAFADMLPSGAHISARMPRFGDLIGGHEVAGALPFLLGAQGVPAAEAIGKSGALNFSVGDSAISLTLECASGTDAQMLSGLAQMLLAQGLEKFNEEIVSHIPENAKAVRAACASVSKAKASSVGSTVKVEAPGVSRQTFVAGAGGIALAALVPAVTTAQRRANASAMSMEGAKLVKGIMMQNVGRGTKSELWPHLTEDDGLDPTDTEDIAGSVYSTSTDYFKALFDIGNQTGYDWAPYVDRDLLRCLWSGPFASPQRRPGELASESVAWTIAAGFPQGTEGTLPVLISSNVDTSSFAISGDCDMSRHTPVRCTGDFAVVVYLNGSARVFDAKGLTLADIYSQQPNMSFPEGIKLKYLHP